MKKFLGAALLGAAVAGASMAQAAVVSSTGAISEIVAPTSVTNAGEGSNLTMLVFNEIQSVVLTSALNLGSVTLAAGTRISSHMLFLNQLDGNSKLTLSGSVTFDGMILGLVTSTGLLASTDGVLGALGTTYEKFKFRGLEFGDSVIASGNTLTATLRVTQPGDWLRIVTAAPPIAPVPVPASGLMLVGALGAVAALRRRRASQA